MKTLSTAIIAGMIAITSTAAFAGSSLIRTSDTDGRDVVTLYNHDDSIVDGRSSSSGETAGDYLTGGSRY